MYSLDLILAIILADLGFLISLLGHEIGHAVAMRIFHARVTKIVSGSGWTFFRFHWGGAPVELKILPTWGFTESPDLPHLPPVDQRLIYVGGPLASLLMALLFALVSTFVPPHFTLIGLHFRSPLRIFIVVNIFLAVLNLLPIPPLDGFKILFAGWKTTPKQDRQLHWVSFGFIAASIILAVALQPAWIRILG